MYTVQYVLQPCNHSECLLSLLLIVILIATIYNKKLGGMQDSFQALLRMEKLYDMKKAHKMTGGFHCVLM